MPTSLGAEASDGDRRRRLSRGLRLLELRLRLLELLLLPLLL